MKMDDKTNEFKLKATWQLGELRTITSLDHNAASSQPSFLIELEASSDQMSKFTWKFEGKEERQEFLTTLWKLGDQFLQSYERPEFRNFEDQGEYSDSFFPIIEWFYHQSSISRQAKEG